MAKRIGVVLSGCGVYDGSEIHEATLTLYFLDRMGAEAVCIAPNKEQYHVIDHLTGQPTSESRNVLRESARIARGSIFDLAKTAPEQLDGVIVPGGFGVAKNLSTVAFEGPKASVDPAVAKLLLEVHRLRRPIGAACISPAVISKVFSDQGIVVTIGDEDQGTASAIQTMGNRHQPVGVKEIVVDEANRIVTTPAYMCAASIGEVGQGIKKLVEWVVEHA